jgi:hypothetical protein
MRTLLDAAIDARDLIIWSNDCYRDVERLIQVNKYQDAIELANNYVEQERARRKRKALGREPEKN